MVYEELIQKISRIEKSEGDCKPSKTPLEQRLKFVEKVFRAGEHLLSRSTSQQQREEYLGRIGVSILDLAYCGDIRTAREYAEKYRELEKQYPVSQIGVQKCQK